MQNSKNNYKLNIILLFLFISAITIASHSFNLGLASWIDIPNHFVGGMVVAAFLPKETFKKRAFLSILTIAIIGIGWEFVEIAMAKKEIFFNLFQETKTDKTGDLIVGLAGLVFAYGRTDTKNTDSK